MSSAPTPPANLLCTLTVNERTSPAGVKRYMLGGEPIVMPDGSPLMDRNGRRSFVTTAASGPSVGKHLLMAYLPVEVATVGTQLAVEYLGDRYAVTVAAVGPTAVFDAEGAHLRS